MNRSEPNRTLAPHSNTSLNVIFGAGDDDSVQYQHTQPAPDDGVDASQLPLGRDFVDAVDAADTRTILSLVRARKNKIPTALVGACGPVRPSDLAAATILLT